MPRNRRFATWLRTARMAAKLTQEDVAERMENSQSAIHVWEKDGVESMAPATIRRLAAALGVQPEEVAAALGYPVAATLPTRPVTEEDDPVVLMEQIAELNRRVAELIARERNRGSTPLRAGG